MKTIDNAFDLSPYQNKPAKLTVFWDELFIEYNGVFTMETNTIWLRTGILTTTQGVRVTFNIAKATYNFGSPYEKISDLHILIDKSTHEGI